MFLDGLPGLPDGVSASPDGESFWVAIVTRFTPGALALVRAPRSRSLRWAVARMPEALQPRIQPYGLVVQVGGVSRGAGTEERLCLPRSELGLQRVVPLGSALLPSTNCKMPRSLLGGCTFGYVAGGSQRHCAAQPARPIRQGLPRHQRRHAGGRAALPGQPGVAVGLRRGPGRPLNVGACGAQGAEMQITKSGENRVVLGS